MKPVKTTYLGMVGANGGTGIEVECLTGPWIVANTVTANCDEGIDLQGTEADGNRVQLNRTIANADNGIVVEVGSTGDFFRRNKAAGNAGLDLENANLPANPLPEPLAQQSVWDGQRHRVGRRAAGGVRSVAKAWTGGLTPGMS